MKFSGYKFEVGDIDNYRIDQLLVTRLDNKATLPAPKLPDAQGKTARPEIRLPEASTAPDSGAVFTTQPTTP